MFWLTIGLLALTVWVARQARTIEDLRSSVSALDLQVQLLRLAEPGPAKAKLVRAAAPAADSGSAAEAPADSPIVVPAALPPQRDEAPSEPIAVSVPVAPQVRTRGGRPLGEILAENGLAWVGGAGLALGGALLVGYMAQQGWYTPLVRLASALALGAGLIVFGEVVRRRGLQRPEKANPLVAGLAAGAGAAVLYAAIWAAHGLYGYIGGAVAAGLLAGVSALLFGLSLRHGEPLAGLALGGAFAVPLVTGVQTWADPALPVYVMAVLATGGTVAGRRGWDRTAALAVAGTLAWSAAAAIGGEALRAVVLALGAAAGGLLLAEFCRRRFLLRLAATALALASGILAILAGVQAELIVQAGLSGLVVLAGIGLRRRRIGDEAFAVTVSACAAGALAAGVTGVGDGPRAAALAHAALSVAVALLATRRLPVRATASGAAAVTAAVLATAVGALWGAPATWLAPLGAAAALALAAGVTSRGRGETADVNLWAGSAAAALLAATIQGADAVSAPAGLALAALALAMVHARLPWRSLRLSAVVGAALALGAALNPVFLEAGWGARPGAALASAALGAGLLWAASRLVGGDRRLKEGVATTAVGLALVSAFIALNWAARQGGGQALDGLTRIALHGLLLLGGGYAALAGEGAQSGIIARARSRVLLGAGAAFTLPLTVVASPWWGLSDRVIGAPLLDSLLLAYLAPAVLLGFAADRFYRLGEHRLARLAVVASTAFAALWVLHAVRRLFDGPAFRAEFVGVFEAGAYALIALGSPLVFETLRRRRGAERGGDMGRATVAFGWAGLASAAVLLGTRWNPWWGAGAESLGTFGAGLAILGVYAAACVASLAPGRAADNERLRSVGRVSAVFHAFVGLTLAVRLAYRGPDLRPGEGVVSLETWTYSAAWALFGVGVLVFGARRGDVVLRWSGLAVIGLTVVKVVLFDLAQLEGVVRAGSFLAVGALLLLGALLARGRLRSGGTATLASAER